MKTRVLRTVKGCLLFSIFLSFFIGGAISFLYFLYLHNIKDVVREIANSRAAECIIISFMFSLSALIAVTGLYFAQVSVWDKLHEERQKEDTFVFLKLIPDIKSIVTFLEFLGTPWNQIKDFNFGDKEDKTKCACEQCKDTQAYEERRKEKHDNH